MASSAVFILYRLWRIQIIVSSCLQINGTSHMTVTGVPYWHKKIKDNTVIVVGTAPYLEISMRPGTIAK